MWPVQWVDILSDFFPHFFNYRQQLMNTLIHQQSLEPKSSNERQWKNFTYKTKEELYEYSSCYCDMFLPAFCLIFEYCLISSISSLIHLCFRGPLRCLVKVLHKLQVYHSGFLITKMKLTHYTENKLKDIR